MRDPDLEWLDHVRPVGLVVAPNLLKDWGLTPLRQTQADTAEVAELLDKDGLPALRDAWSFASQILGWEARNVAGSPSGPTVPDELLVKLTEYATTLSPTWAVTELGHVERRWQLLVRIEAAGIEPDARGALDGWEATPHQRFERLLRETSVFAGVLITDNALRLVYAPRGETSGYLSFPLRPLGTVVGRPMLAGLKLLLDYTRLFTDADDRRLPALLQRSREAQAAVSTALAEQVLGALHELLRGRCRTGADPSACRAPVGPRLRRPAGGADAAGVHPLCRGPGPAAVTHRRPVADALRERLFGARPLVTATSAIIGLFRTERPALGGHPGPGGWRRIGPT